MKLTFIGACHEVTGSCFLLQHDGLNILIDSGMKQGTSDLVSAPLPINEWEIDYIFLTHAHIDHSGNIPYLYKKGFRGKVICTIGTKELSNIMLKDSAYIQMSDAAWINKHNERSGKEKVEPLYTIEDVENVLKRFEAYDYQDIISISDNISIVFQDAGHLLGSASIIVMLGTKSNYTSIVFSGDIGNENQPLIKNPSNIISQVDYVVMESTYGNRVHEKPKDYISLLASIIQKTFDRGGDLIIPSFAVGRAQELLYFIREIKEKNMIRNHPNFKVYLDSPLANEATEIYDKRVLSYCNSETAVLIEQGINPIIFNGLVRTTSVLDSKAISANENPKIIISAAGMCDAGRIRHHLKHNLWRSECTIMFVGYQAVGTLGRIILDGATKVKIFGEEIKVSAEIIQFPGISAHADSNGLVKWINALSEKPKKVFVVHGDDNSTISFCHRLIDEYGLDAVAPYSGTEYNLLTNEFEHTAGPTRIAITSHGNSFSKSFSKLLNAYENLGEVVNMYEYCANKDIEKFSTQICDLAQRWDD